MSICKLVVLSDMQIDYEDTKTLSAVHEFVRDFAPDTIVLNGDIIDFTSLSHFRLTLAERTALEYQLDRLEGELHHLRDIAPAARIVYVLGNHEARLADYLVEHAPELAFLGDRGVLSFASITHLADYGVELIEPYGAAYEWHGVTITHGKLIRQNTARANMETEGGSGITGHTHKLGSYFKTDRNGAHGWFESGCLCDLGATPPAVPGIRNWQQGFIVGYGVHAEDTGCVDKVWSLYPVSIVKHRFVFNGKLYEPTS